MRKPVSEWLSNSEIQRVDVIFVKVVLDKFHWMIYFLVPAMYPRFLITLDDDLEPKPVTVRVGTVRPYTQLSSFLSNHHPLLGCRRRGPGR